MRFLLYISLTVVLSVAACTRDSNRPLAGGRGGRAVLRTHPYNATSGRKLAKATVYIKYATWDPPADGIYDDSVQCVQTDSAITGLFTGMRAGDYYLFARGYDSVVKPPQYVSGGAKIIFDAEGVIVVNIPALP